MGSDGSDMGLDGEDEEDEDEDVEIGVRGVPGGKKQARPELEDSDNDF